MSIPSLLDELNVETKPPYAVPSMAEVKATPWNGLTAASSFSGCGGSSLGLRMAGWRVPYACEFTPYGAETYRLNSSAYVDERDVRAIQACDILDRLDMRPGELDLFEGSPPCSSFSSAGNQSGGFKVTRGKVKDYSEGIKQRTDDLFDEWLRLVEGLAPRAVIAENVPDLAKPGEPQAYLHTITGALSSLGYDVHADVYSAGRAGAATWRRRLIIIGVRRDVGVVPRPKLLDEPYTMGEAMAALPIAIPADELHDAWADGSNGRKRSAYADHWEQCLTPGTKHSKPICKVPRDDGKHSDLFTLRRASWELAVPTMTATRAASVMHPDECRYLTATEMKWLSGFPADFELAGEPINRYERIGRAVPPPLYRALGPYLERALKGGA